MGDTKIWVVKSTIFRCRAAFDLCSVPNFIIIDCVLRELMCLSPRMPSKFVLYTRMAGVKLFFCSYKLTLNKIYHSTKFHNEGLYSTEFLVSINRPVTQLLYGRNPNAPDKKADLQHQGSVERNIALYCNDRLCFTKVIVWIHQRTTYHLCGRCHSSVPKFYNYQL